MRPRPATGTYARLSIAIALILCGTGILWATDGEIVSREAVILPATTVEEMIEASPEIQDVFDNVSLYRIRYTSAGIEVPGYLAMPDRPEIVPAIIYNRGGNRQIGLINDQSAWALLGKMASWGYVVVASQYRGTYGNPGSFEFGGASVADVLNLISVIESLDGADPSRIGMFGWSYGGALTYMALRETTRIAAAAVGGGVSDWFALESARPEIARLNSRWMTGYSSGRDAALTERSAVFWAGKLCDTTPLLLLHGGADEMVAVDQTLRMAQALSGVGHPYRLIVFEGAGHGISVFVEQSNSAVREWMNTYVRNRMRVPGQ